MHKTLIFSFAIACLLSSCQSPQVKKQIADKDAQIVQLEQQLTHLQSTNEGLLNRLEDLSVINRSDAESIRNSMSSLNKQFEYIEELTEEIKEKDSINAVLVHNLKSSLNNFDDEDIQIEVKGNAVYVSLSDRMLFQTGSSKISNRAHDVLEKVSMIINDNNDLNILVEGHTDDLPISNSLYRDNWDLSVSRATSVVRLLHKKYDVDPARLTAAGKGEFTPKYENISTTGRSNNRRTEIIMTPKLDQFFKLLEMEALDS